MLTQFLLVSPTKSSKQLKHMNAILSTNELQFQLNYASFCANIGCVKHVIESTSNAIEYRYSLKTDDFTCVSLARTKARRRVFCNRVNVVPW